MRMKTEQTIHSHWSSYRVVEGEERIRALGHKDVEARIAVVGIVLLVIEICVLDHRHEESSVPVPLLIQPHGLIALRFRVNSVHLDDCSC